MHEQDLHFEIYQDFDRYPLKCFLDVTCTIWLCLEFRGLHSAWFFNAHLLFVHTRRQVFEPRIGFVGSRVNIFARGPFWG